MRNARRLALLSCLLAGCSHGTYVALEIAPGAAPPPSITSIDLDAMLDGKPAHATLQDGGKVITLPTSASLQLEADSSGKLTLTATAHGAGASQAAAGSAQVEPGETVSLQLTLGQGLIAPGDDLSFGADLGGVDLSPAADLQVNVDLSPDPNADGDGDGFSPAQGDCNDHDANVGPMAFEVAGNDVDDDCNGKVDDVLPSCDGSATGNAATDLASVIELCDPRFLTLAVTNGPSDTRARASFSSFGVVAPQGGGRMALLSTGIAAVPGQSGFVEPSQGTALGNQFPLPQLVKANEAGCTELATNNVNDYTEIALTLKVPQNARSFSLASRFFSAEWPQFVCSDYADQFMVLVTSHAFNGVSTDVVLDGNGVDVDTQNAFFTDCVNGTTPFTQGCTNGIDVIAGTGYDSCVATGADGGCSFVGGATPWLTSSVPVVPSETITVRILIFDQGDHILDSVALVDNFQWSTATVAAPVTSAN